MLMLQKQCQVQREGGAEIGGAGAFTAEWRNIGTGGDRPKRNRSRFAFRTTLILGDRKKTRYYR